MSSSVQSNRYSKPKMRAAAGDLPRRAYRIQSFCAVFDVGMTKAHQEIRSGRLKAVKRGGVWLIAAEDAEAWLRGEEGSSHAPS
jgi:hypothetical protein